MMPKSIPAAAILLSAALSIGPALAQSFSQGGEDGIAIEFAVVQRRDTLRQYLG